MKMIAVMMISLAGCATVPGDAPPMPAERSESACNAEQTQHLVGRPATSELAAEAQRRSGASIVRWLRPGQIVTMEYRADRLNIMVDANNRVESIRCG